ncbi:MAG: FeoA family protein [Candidatus Omnitrophota bacterium]
MGKLKVLSDLKARDKGKVKQITGQGQLKKKLLDMGVIPGNEFEVLRVAPLGDPVEVRIKGYNLSLRKEEARQISVEALEA